MSHFKKLRLIHDFFLRQPPLSAENEDSNCDKLLENSKDGPLESLDHSDQNCQDLEQLVDEHTPTELTKSNEPNLDGQENHTVSKIHGSKLPCGFELPEGKRMVHVPFGGSMTNYYNLSSIHHWKHIKSVNLRVKYCCIYSPSVAKKIFNDLEKEIQYLKPEESKVQVYGKWHQIPRKHAAYGEKGVTYTFSKATLPAKSWDSCPTILELKKVAEKASGETYNFVLINRYKDGQDYMGEHKDNESDLVAKSAISSFSFGQGRDFLFKYDKNKLKDRNQRGIPSFKQFLESGSLLIMEHPTNIYWYHSLPVRKNAFGVRINLTFRNIVKKC